MHNFEQDTRKHALDRSLRYLESSGSTGKTAKEVVDDAKTFEGYLTRASVTPSE